MSAIATTQEKTSLAVNFDEHALRRLTDQRNGLRKFISSQLSQDVDFGVIPGTQKPTLFKPGAEKLANLFQLGMRIVREDKDLDMQKGWAMFTYTVELIHLPTGTSVSQCQGSANSHEKKFKSRPASDQINTLMKMAQKRAYVGAVIIACGASDFFTQDMEDSDPEPDPPTPRHRAVQPAPVSNSGEDPGGYVINFGKKNFGKRLRDVPIEELQGFAKWLHDQSRQTGKPVSGKAVDFLAALEAFEFQYPRDQEGGGIL